MQKNKINVVKAVCNSAAKKLAVLGLAMAVSGGCVASAQMSEREAKKQLSAMSSLERLIETNGDKEKRQRLNALNNTIENIQARYNRLERQAKEKEQQVEEKTRQVEEKRRQAEEQSRQAEGMLDQISRHRCLVIENFLLSEANDLAAEINTLLKEIKTLEKEINTLLIELTALSQQRNALRDELEGEISEAHRDQAELMDLAVAEASRQNIPVREFAPGFFANIGLQQEAIQNIMRLFGHSQQQNQRQQYFGGSLNPFNWGLFGSKK